MDVDLSDYRSVPEEELPGRLPELLARAGRDKDRVVLTRNGKPFAAIVPLDDIELLQRIEDQIDIVEAHKALEEWEAEGCPIVPLSDILEDFRAKR
jgi:prevent-host-death family protein